MNGRSPKTEEASNSNMSSWLESLRQIINIPLVGIKYNVSNFFQTTFQELLVNTVLATFTALVDYSYFTLLRKEGEDDTVPIGFPFAIILGVVFIKFLLETTALKGFCAYIGVNYVSNSSPQRITVKFFLMALLAGFKYLAPYFEVQNRQKEREDYASDQVTWWGYWILKNLLNMWALCIGMLVAHVGMIAFLRTYIDAGIYSYKLLTYRQKEGMEVYEEKKEEEARRYTKELNNNSHLNFRSPHERGVSNRVS